MAGEHVDPDQPVDVEVVDDGEGFDPSLVPAGPLSDFFYDGRTGAGLSNDQWDEQRARLREVGDDPFDN